MSAKSQHSPSKPVKTHPLVTETTTSQPVKSNDGLAITSMVLGVTSIVTFTGFLLGIPALILGIVALRKKTGERGLGIAGIVTGAISTFFSFLFLAFIAWMVVYAAQHPEPSRNSDYPSEMHHYDSDFRSSSEI